MVDPDLAIRTAYYNAITGNIPIGNDSPEYTVPFYVQVPSDTTYPYIYNSDFTKTRNRTKDCFGWDVTVTLVIVSFFQGNSGGQATNDKIATQVEELIVGPNPANQNLLNFGTQFYCVSSDLITSTTMPPQDVEDGTVFYRILKFKHLTFQQV